MKLLKNSICQINNGIKLSPTSFLIIEVLSSLQIIHLIFKNMSFTSQNYEVILNSLSKITYYLTGTFEVKDHLSFATSLKILWGFYTSYLGCFILLHLLAISQIFSSKKLTKKVSRFLGILYLVHSRVLFFPIQFFFVGLCYINNFNLLAINDQFLQSSTWFIINIILSVINCCLALPKEFILFQITEGENFDAIKTNVFHKGIFIYKSIFIVLQFVFENNKAYLGVSSIFQFIFFWSLFGYYRIKLPFYNFRLLKFCAIMNAIWLCLSFLAILQAFGTSSHLRGLQICIILLPILGVKLALSQFKHIFINILKGKLLSKDQALHFGLLLSELTLPGHISQVSDKRFFPDSQFLIGILTAEGVDEMYLHWEENMKYEEKLQQSIIKRLESYLIKFHKSPEVLLFLANLYWKATNIGKFIEIFRKIEDLNLDFRYRNTIEKFQDKLKSLYQEEFCQDKDIEQIRLAKYFKYNQLTSTLKRDMLEEINLHVHFWKGIENKKLDFKEIMDCAVKIDSIFMKIENIYEKESEAFRQKFLLALLLHVVYLNKVRNLTSEGNQKFSQFQSAYSHKLSQHLYKADFDETAVVVVSLDKKNVGQILDVSDSFMDMFHIPKAKLFELNFSCLFPNGIAQFYQIEIEKYSKAPTYKLDTKYDTHGKTAEEQIFELEAHFQLHFHLDNELSFIIKLKKTSPYLPIIIANHDGVVVDYSKTLKDSLWKNEINYENIRKIQTLNNEFEEVNKAFNATFADPNVAEKLPNIRNMASYNSKGHSFPGSGLKTNDYTQFETLAELTKERTLNRQLLTNDLQDSSRPLNENMNSYRALVKEKQLETCRTEDVQIKEINKDKALHLCERYMNGESIVINEDLSHGSRKYLEVKATVQIKPHLIDAEVYKVLSLKNLRAHNVPSFQGNEEEQLQSCEFSISRDLDEFTNGEKIVLKPFFMQTSSDLVIQKEYTPENLVTGVKVLDVQIPSFGNLEEESKLTEKVQCVKQNNINNEDNKSHQMMFLSKDIRGKKLMQDISNSKKIQPLLKLYIVIVYLIFLFILTLTCVNYYLSRSATNEVKTGINVVSAATQRDINVIQAWQNAIYVYLSAFGQLIPNSSGPFLQFLLGFYASSLKSKTNELKDFVSSLHQDSLMKYTLEKDIIFRFNSSDPIPFRTYDTFGATDYLLSEFLFLSNYPDFNELRNNEEVPYILNNTANDFLIKSTELTSTIKKHFKSLISHNIVILSVVLISEFVAIIFLLISLITLAFIVRRTYDKFFSVLTKVKEKNVLQRLNELNQVKALLEQDTDEKSFIGSATNFITKESNHKVQENSFLNRSNSKKFIFITKNMDRYLQKQVFFSIAFIPLLFGLFVSSLMRSISSFRILENANNQIGALSEMYRQFILITSTYTYQTTFPQNPEFLIYYKSPKDQVLESLETYPDLIINLSEAFLIGNNDEKDPFLDLVLQEDMCSLLPSNQSYFCHYWASKAGNQGFLSVNYYFLQNARDNIMIYQKNPTNWNAIQVSFVFNFYLSYVIHMLDTSFEELTTYVISRLEALVNEALQKNVSYLIGILATVIIYFVFLYKVPLKRLRTIDLGRRKIIKILPYQMIQENRILSFYFVQKFRNEIEGLKSAF